MPILETTNTHTMITVGNKSKSITQCELLGNELETLAKFPEKGISNDPSVFKVCRYSSKIEYMYSYIQCRN